MAGSWLQLKASWVNTTKMTSFPAQAEPTVICLARMPKTKQIRCHSMFAYISRNEKRSLPPLARRSNLFMKRFGSLDRVLCECEPHQSNHVYRTIGCENNLNFTVTNFTNWCFSRFLHSSSPKAVCLIYYSAIKYPPVMSCNISF